MYCPCKDCDERFIGCHSNCLKYLDYKDKNDNRLNDIKKARTINDYAINRKSTIKNSIIKRKGK